jgi:transposase
MPKPYCVELRERAVAAFDAGVLQTEVVRLFKISLASLKPWLAQHRAGQSLAPKTYRPGPRGSRKGIDSSEQLGRHQWVVER